MCVFQFATQHRFLLINVWGGEYEAHASATSVCISFRGHMGSGVTATPVTVTVATFGTMAFYEMKLKIHREPEIKKIFSSWACTVTMELWYKTELISSSDSKEYHGCLNITCEKEEGKKSLFFYNALCLHSPPCFEDFYKRMITGSFLVNYAHYHSTLSHQSCGAMHQSGWQVMAERIWLAVLCLWVLQIQEF